MSNIKPIHGGVGSVSSNGTAILFQGADPGFGGKFRIMGAKAVNRATTSGTASFSLQLFRYSAGVISGTITGVLGGTQASGTASHWTALTQKDFTIVDNDAAVVGDGDVIVCVYTMITTGASDNLETELFLEQGA